MLELRNIKKYFNKGTPSETIAINDLSLQIKPGDFVTVIGGNGAGKSTLLNIIAGSIESDSGLILLNDNDISFMSEHKRAPYFGRVFQDPMSGTAADMSILENLTIAYGRGRMRSLFKWFIQRKDRFYLVEQVKSLDLGLENRLNEKVGLLSGGQRQALTLLMATIRQTPSERVIKRDYVRFCEGDKIKAKEEVELGLKSAKDEKKASLVTFEKEFVEYKNKLNAMLNDFKKRNEAFEQNASDSKEDKFEIQERKRIYKLYKKDLKEKAYRYRVNGLERIKEEYHSKISKFDLTKQILLLDEHTAALDPKTASKVLDITERIVNENNLTTIMITHNMKDAIRYGNRLIMMSHGKVVVDVSGKEKSKLTVEDLLNMFQVASKDDFLSDSAILG